VSETTQQWRSRVRLVDEVAQELRDRIYAGTYAPGQQLRQEQMAEELQISRTPLREAMRILESEGLLYSEPGRGARVVSADVKQLLAAYRMREVIDGLAARLAAESPDAARRAQLSQMLERQRAALRPWQPALYAVSNVEFHIAVMELADNEYLTAQIPLVRMTSQVFRPVGPVEEERAILAVAEHGGIAQAIAEGRGEEAERLARRHINVTIERLAL